MLLSLGVVMIAGFLGGWAFDKIRLPKIVWYLILGILLGPSVLNFIDKDLLNISAYLRQIALVIIITRVGLSLDLKKLKQIGRPAALLCFVPAVFEICGVVAFAPMLLDISHVEALLLGTVLAGVSLAVIVPRMLKLKKDGINKNDIPELIMAGASCEDVIVVVLFYAFKGFVKTNNFDALSIVLVPVSLLLGVAIGIVLAVPLIFLFKKVKMDTSVKVVCMLGASLVMLGVEKLLESYIGISSLLGVLTLSLAVAAFIKEDAKNIEGQYNGLWALFEILLFFLIGCAADIKYAFSINGLLVLGLLAISFVFRAAGVFVSLLFTKFSWKERFYILISYIPKATVQASIGGIALIEGMPCGAIILTGAVITILLTAPLGAILMDTTYKKLICNYTQNAEIERVKTEIEEDK